MASGVNVKMGVSGVSQFKQDINAVKQSLKTMDTQLSLTEKEFKATGDAEKYLQDKATELNAKLEMQKSILSKAESALDSMTKNGVDKSSKAFQDMQREVLNAKAAMIDTKTEISELGTNAGTAADNTDLMNTQLKNIGKGVAFENVTSGLKDIINKLENGAKAAVNFGKKVAQSATDSTQWADDILHDAEKYGVDAETIQKMQNAAEYIETDVDTIMNARARLAKNTDKLGDILGINAGGMSVEDAFWAAGEAIMAMTDEFKKEDAAQTVFGRNWKELIPLFTAGQQKYNEELEKQNVLTNEQVAKLGKADDAFKRVQQEVERLKNEFWAENADKITDLLQWVVDHKEAVVTALGAIATAFGALKLGEAATNVMKLLDGLKSLGFGGAAAGAAGGGGSVVGGTVGGALKGILGAAAVPASVVAAAVTPALLAQKSDERRWAAQKESRLATAETLSGGDKAFLIAAAEALDQHYRLSGDSYTALMGLGDRGTVEKARLFSMLSGKSNGWNGNYATDELLNFWQTKGEGWDQGRIDGLLTTITDSYSEMTKATEAITGGSDAQKQSSSEMIQAAGTLEGMPGLVEAAIVRGMSNIKIFIDGATAGKVLSPYVGAQMGGIVAALSRA